MKLKVIETEDSEYFLDCITEFHAAIKEDAKNVVFVKSTHLAFWRQMIRWMRLALRFVAFRLPAQKNDTVYFSVQMGPDFAKNLPFCLKSRNNYIYMYDAWPRYHSWMKLFIRAFHIKGIFFSSSQVTAAFNKAGFANAYWVPEGIDIRRYAYKDYNDKDVDVVEFGRRFESYHEKIKGPLAQHNKVHLYKKEGMSLLFDSQSDFVQGLARSKVSICVPSNITHFERSEDICTMTLRYLQSMASKCLVVGITPPEMVDLFGYNPVIEIDQQDAGNQMIAILENYERYIPLIERNYEMVMRNHTWAERWRDIKRRMDCKMT